MTSDSLPPDATQLLRDPAKAGVYCADEDAGRVLFQTGPTAGFNAYRIDLGQVRSARDLHRVFGKGLHFPEWYGANWDALADSLTDMSWNEADGYLLVLQCSEALQRQDPDTFATLLEILRTSVDVWRKQHIAFWVLFIGSIPDIPRIGVST